MKIFRTRRAIPWVCPIPILLLHQDGEAGVDAVDLLDGKDRSCGKDLVQILHGYGPDPSEPFDVEDGPWFVKTTAPLNQRPSVCPSNSLSLLILRHS